MKFLKVIAIALIVYLGIVVLFETLLGYFQPEAGNTMVITTFEEDGAAHSRVVSRLESGDQFYVAVNHWPRAWYRRILDNPAVEVTYAGQTGRYQAVRLSGAEFERIDRENSRGLVFMFLTGFPRRHILRLDPL